MSFFLFGLIVAVVGATPLLIAGKAKMAAVLGVPALLGLWAFCYLYPPVLANPMWGITGILFFATFISSLLAVFLDNSSGRRAQTSRATYASLLIPIGILAVVCVRSLVASSVFQSAAYANMIGAFETHEWTQDVQPKDPNHVNKVPKAYALWVANKAMGTAEGGAIGSQFSIDEEHVTIQMVKGELMYVVPLMFKDWGTWWKTDGVPGYVMVSAEDPTRSATAEFGKKYTYMPSAYLGHELLRHVWGSGFATKKVLEATFEIDDDHHGWWIVSVGRPSIGWSADVVDGVVQVNPENGATTFIPADRIPDWMDRVIPAEVVEERLTWRGQYANGWWNTVFAKLNITEPETITFVHGSDDQPYFVADITSNNANDDALIGLAYVNARTGEAKYYKTPGGMTSTAALQKVNGKVSYKKWHGSTPVLYNMYGTMADIVPLLAENGTYQGVAIVNVLTGDQVAVGETMNEAVREYQKLLVGGAQASPELASQHKTLQGTVARFAPAGTVQGTTFYLLLNDGKTIFSADAQLSPKLLLTQPGDKVTLTFIDSNEQPEPLIGFDNLNIVLDPKAVGAPISQ